MAGPVNRPVVVFNFEKKQVTTFGANPSLDKRVAEAIAAQRELVSTGSGTPKPR